MSRVIFQNSTTLCGKMLEALCREGIGGRPVGYVDLLIRYTRSSDFSGRCFYADQRIMVNIGRHLRYPYTLNTSLAKARIVGQHWYKPAHVIELTSAYELVAFIFMHELYHLLVHRARRNPRQKESMCDRFAARFVVERFGATVRTTDGRPVLRESWDFQDLETFVAAARRT